ncbi:hypothetical protein Avbf_01495 [Armadillidium vulgare]|nr:hypothetical protein Avbf_01495 [Armadillidium vulgare]
MGIMEEWKIGKVCRCSIPFPTSQLKQNQWTIYEPENGLVLQFSKNTLYKCRLLFKGENGVENCSSCYSVLKFYCADSAQKTGVHNKVNSLPLIEEVLPVEDAEDDVENDSPSFLTEPEIIGTSEGNEMNNKTNDAEECVVVDVIPSTNKARRQPSQKNINEFENLVSPSTSTTPNTRTATSAKSLLIKKKNQTRIIKSLFKSPSVESRIRKRGRQNKRLKIQVEKPQSEEVINLVEEIERPISQPPSGRKRGRKKKTEKNTLLHINKIFKNCSLKNQGT